MSTGKADNRKSQPTSKQYETCHARNPLPRSGSVQPIGGANGDEPFSPVSNAASVAAHPRRSPRSFGQIAMTIARFILALAILLFAAYIVVMNWGCVIVSMRNKRRGIDRHHSTVPIVSFIFTALAFLIYPRPDKMWMISVPLLDIANWSLLWFPVVLIRESRTKRITEPGGPANGSQPSDSE